MSKREFLQHKLINTVIKTDSEGKPVTAGQLGLTKRQTLEALKQAKPKKASKHQKNANT